MNNKKIHSFSDDILADLDGVGLATLIKNKAVSPTEVVEATIERAKKVAPQLNAIVTDCFEKSLAAAKQPLSGFFAGVPTFIKDLTHIEGMRTYFGTEALANVAPSIKTDPIAQQIFDQGFIHLGNSSLPEFGFTCSTEFPNSDPTCNPWNLNYSVGGSSGGAAALVAAGVVPIAHTADGGGSTRIPAACCGLVGLKGSRGRLLKSSAFEKGAIKSMATVEIKINYFRPATSGELHCKTKVIHCGKKLANLESEIWEADKLIARANGTFFINLM